uniref:Uncharacterized protein n=1 Tax=Cacopsylla melanoneura TaxID=428564 RepID=A0A8D8LYB3_9HEMI
MHQRRHTVLKRIKIKVDAYNYAFEERQIFDAFLQIYGRWGSINALFPSNFHVQNDPQRIKWTFDTDNPVLKETFVLIFQPLRRTARIKKFKHGRQDRSTGQGVISILTNFQKEISSGDLCFLSFLGVSFIKSKAFL